MALETSSRIIKLLATRSTISDNDCWLYNGYLNKDGYGEIYYKGDNHALVHRIAYIELVGIISTVTPFVLHKCDIKNCWNPRHLYTGTRADNNHDIRLRGNAIGKRGNLGVHNPTSKLSDSDVIEMRRLYDTGRIGCRRLAKKFNISLSTAHSIVTRKTWRHI